MYNHQLLVFACEMKHLYYLLLKIDLVFIANGFIDFLMNEKTSLQEAIDKMFFRIKTSFFLEGGFAYWNL